MGTAQVQGELWGIGAEVWAELQEPTGAPIYDAAFDEVGVTDGTRLLDVGCGSGYALLLAHKRGATVTGIDASGPMLAVADSRLPQASLTQGEIEELPYDDHAFDCVTAFNSVQYAADPVQALREIKRVAKPKAPVAVATWGDPDKCEAKVMIAAVGSLLPPPPPGAGGPFALAAPGALEALVESAHLTAERAIEVPTPFLYADMGTAVRANLSSGPIQIAIRSVGAEQVEETIRRVFQQFVQADGTVRMDNVFRVVIAVA
jgi:SAM-dependent methyltransferase